MSVLSTDVWNEIHSNPEEEKSYSEYLLKKGRELPDAWKPRKQKYPSEQIQTIYFRTYKDAYDPENPEAKITIYHLSGIKDYVKAYAYKQFYLNKRDYKTVNVKVRSIARFFENYVGSRCNPKTNFKNAFINQIDDFKKMIKTNAINGVKDGGKKTLIARAIDVYDFMLFLEQYSKTNTWVNKFDLQTELPEKLVKYFNKEEIEVYRLEIVAANKKNKTPALSWSTTYEVAKFIDDFKGFNYALEAVAISLESGLRISEIRELKRDCLKPVTKEEEKAVARYFARQGKSPIRLDYSKSRWLVYHVIKGQGGELIEGTPILVGKRVIDAINRVMDATAELAEESKSNMLFLNKPNGRDISVRSYTMLLKDLRELFELGMPLVKFHQCRATFATILYFLDIPIGVIEKYLNHVSSDVTKGYVDAREDESSSALSWILQNKLDENADERLKALRVELLKLVGSSTFLGLSHNSRLKLFQRLQTSYGVKLKISDHGVCVLPDEEKCPHGFETVLPCHSASCDKFNPDTDDEAKDFFQALLSNNNERINELEELALTHGGVQINFDILHIEKSSLEAILQTVKKAS